MYIHLTLFLFFRKSAQAIDPKVQRGLFIFAVSNSCIDPIVYGMYRYIMFIDRYKSYYLFNTLYHTLVVS